MFEMDMSLARFCLIAIEANIATRNNLISKPKLIYNVEKDLYEKINEEKNKGTFPSIYYKLLFCLDENSNKTIPISREEIYLIIDIIQENTLFNENLITDFNYKNTLCLEDKNKLNQFFKNEKNNKNLSGGFYDLINLLKKD